MTDAPAVAAPAAHPHRRRGLVALCLTQIVMWGILYYSLPVAAAEITADTGWPDSLVMGTLSAAMLVQAAAAIPAGHAIARFGPRTVMTVGTIVAAGALLLSASAAHPAAFIGGWLIAGAAMAGTLYQAAFTAITEWFAPRAIGALTVVTLAGGLASTVFAPVVSALLDATDWRTAYLALAVIIAAIALPLHATLPARPQRAHDRARGERAPAAETARIARSPLFVALAAAISLSTLGVSAAHLNIIAFLQERGFDHAVGALALGLVGLGQVLGRLGYPRLSAAVPVLPRAILSIAASAIALALLVALPISVALVMTFALLLGAARGLTTLIHASGLSELWDARHYAVLAGHLSLPVTAAGAIAPWAGAFLAETTGGYGPAFVILMAITALSAVALLLALRGSRHA